MDNVDAHLSRAHQGQTGATLIGESLTVVIVLLFAHAQGCKNDVGVDDVVDVVETRAGGSSKAEVIHDDC